MKYLAALVIAVVLLLSAACSPRFLTGSGGGRYVYFPVDPRLLVTPQADEVRQAVSGILADKVDPRSDFRKLQDWVASHIRYTQDSYYTWQTPATTLEKRTGNCKDFAILLCSLVRAAGVPAGDVYVAIGKDRSNNSHAFIIEKWLQGRWQVIEPQAGGLFVADLSAADTADRYAITARFNDVSYYGDTAYITGSETFLASSAAVTPGASPGPGAAGPLPQAAPLPALNPLPEVDYFYFKPAVNVLGTPGAAVLAWQVSGADSVYIDNGIGWVSQSGNRVITAPPGTYYTITARNGNGTSRSIAVR